MEATLMGIPAIAVSLVTMGEGENYQAAAKMAVKIARQLLVNGLPADTFLNVNVPDLPFEQLGKTLVTTQGKRRYEGTIVDKVDPRGRNYYWIGTADLRFHDIEGTDYHAVSRGHVSITPLHLDLTNHSSLPLIASWALD
jgi:5'-nucleotidase